MAPAVSGRRLLLALLLWAVLAGALLGGSVAALRLLARTWAAGHRADLGAVLLLDAYVALLGALLLAFGGPAGMRERLRFRYTSAADIAGALGVWVLAVFGGLVLTRLLEPVLGPPQSNAAPLLRQPFDPPFAAAVVVTICVLAPIGEELLFRGALFGWLRRWLPAPAAIPVTAGVFAGAHLLPTLLPVLFALGLGATWIRERTGSTLNSFAMHATQNTFAVAVTYLVLTRSA